MDQLAASNLNNIDKSSLDDFSLGDFGDVGQLMKSLSSMLGSGDLQLPEQDMIPTVGNEDMLNLDTVDNPVAAVPNDTSDLPVGTADVQRNPAFQNIINHVVNSIDRRQAEHCDKSNELPSNSESIKNGAYNDETSNGSQSLDIADDTMDESSGTLNTKNESDVDEDTVLNNNMDMIDDQSDLSSFLPNEETLDFCAKSLLTTPKKDPPGKSFIILLMLLVTG